MKSERITILVTAAEKAQISRRAKAMNIPTSELLRRAFADYDPDTDSEELEALADEFERVVQTTEAKLDNALSKLSKMRTLVIKQDK